jgi:hypothetical protein
MGQFGGAPGSARHIISKIFSPRIGVPYTSACTTKHFPSPDARQRSRLFAPSESTAETHPQLQLALLRLLATISQ